MNKMFFYGLLLVLFSLVLSLITSNWDLTFIITGIAGLGALTFSGLLSGAFASGDRNRANYHSQDQTGREERYQLMVNSLWFAIPNVVAAITTVVIVAST